MKNETNKITEADANEILDALSDRIRDINKRIAEYKSANNTFYVDFWTDKLLKASSVYNKVRHQYSIVSMAGE
jgi:chorismate mutase